jgi:hypothetical protein
MAILRRQKIGQEVIVEEDTLSQSDKGLKECAWLLEGHENEEMCTLILRFIQKMVDHPMIMPKSPQ